MSALVWTNNANTTIASALAPGSTTITLATGTGALFPSLSSGQYFVGSLTDAATQTLHEIVWVTAISGDTLTVTRGQESTTARSWNFGDIFAHQLTAGQMRSLTQGGFSAQTRFISSQQTIYNQPTIPGIYTALTGSSFTFPTSGVGAQFLLHISAQIVFGGNPGSGNTNNFYYGQIRQRVLDTTNNVDLLPVCGQPVFGSIVGAGFMVSQAALAGNESDLETTLDSGGVPSAGTTATTRLYAQGATISFQHRVMLTNTGDFPIPSGTAQGILLLTAIPA